MLACVVETRADACACRAVRGVVWGRKGGVSPGNEMAVTDRVEVSQVCADRIASRDERRQRTRESDRLIQIVSSFGTMFRAQALQNWLSIITGAVGRALDMGAYTGADGSVELKREHHQHLHHMPRHMRHPRADLVAFLDSTPGRSRGMGGCESTSSHEGGLDDISNPN